MVTHVKSMTLNPYLTPYLKNQLSCMKELNVTNLFKENIGGSWGRGKDLSKT